MTENCSPAVASARDSGAPLVPSNYRRDARQTWHQRRRHRCVLSLLEGLKGEVLDCGCGYGDLTYAISKTHAVEGADVDPDRIAYAADEYAPIAFRQITSDRLAYSDQAFDIVASVVVIHFVPDPIGHLQELHRILRENGRLILVCKNVDYIRNTFRRLLGGREAPTPLWVRSRSYVIDLLKREGFHVEAESHFYDPPFTSWKNLGDVCIGLVKQGLSLLHIKPTCGYFALVARKG